MPLFESRSLSRFAPLGAGLLAGLLLLGVVTGVDVAERERLERARHAELEEEVSLVRARLEGHLNKVIASAQSLALLFATQPNLQKDTFERLAREVLGPNPSIVNVGLIRGTVIHYVHPQLGSEKALGLDISQTPSMWPAFQRMMATRSVVIAGPVALVQGGMGIIVRIPVFRADPEVEPGTGTFLGAISIPLNAEQVFRQTGLDAFARRANVAVRGRDGLGPGGDTFLGDAALFGHASARQEILVSGGVWEIAASPHAGATPAGLILVRSLGAMLCCAVFALAYAAVHHNQRRRLDQHRMQALNQRLHAVPQAVPDLLFEIDARGQYQQIWAGPNAEKLVRPPSDLLGRNIADVLPPSAVQEVLAAIGEAARVGTSTGRQIVLPLPGGDTCFELAVAPIAAPSGDATHYLVLSRDVTQRQKVEQELRIAATAFQSLDGMLITDAEHRILRVNQAFTDITGYGQDEAVGRTPSLLKSGRQDAAFYRTMNEALREHGRWSGEIWNRRKNGETYPEWLSISAVRDTQGRVSHYVGAFVDVTERKRAESEIRYLAFHDPLTGLPNRRLLLERLDQALTPELQSGHHGALLFIDLDDFKTVNDARGHVLGDLLLQQTAQRLTAQVRDDDTVARLGGDEFVVLLQRLSTDACLAQRQAMEIGEKIRAAVASGYALREQRYRLSCSVGVRVFEAGEPAEELLKNADTAMHAAKGAGRNEVRVFDPSMQTALELRAELEADMREGMAQRQFRLFYQVKVDQAGRAIGAEALMRWQHPRRGLIAPADFIPLAEETGHIVALGDWALEAALIQLQRWQQHEATRNLSLAVNISGRQLREPSFATRLQVLLDGVTVNPARLELEITESMLLDDVETIVGRMQQLKRLGLRFAIDDFGTGYSSLQYLKRLPLDTLKIDRVFVTDLASADGDRGLVRTILGMAQGMNLATVAEGVETQEQLDALVRHGCQHFQGYFFGRPQPIDVFEAAVFNTPPR